jgi:D-3-phosphoglycerate dehydrogenase / 2-oxoglutarate reductase
MDDNFTHPNTEKKVLITDDCHFLLIENLEKRGFRVDFEPEITPEMTLERIKNYDGLIINSKILVNEAFLAAAPRLKFIGRLGSGMEIVDRAAAAKYGVAVHSSPEGNRNAVAEHALGMLLMLFNNLGRADREVRQKIWHREKNRGREIAGKTLGIIGYGHNGRQFAKKISGLEMPVLAFDKFLPSGFAADENWVEEVSFEAILERSDIISLHVPLTEETRFLVDKKFFEKTKNGVILINLSRGKCVKTADLLDALNSEKCGGACLDVFENEKPATYSSEENEIFEQLFKKENVVFSPHVGGWTHESKRKMAEVLIEKIFG